MPLPNPEPGLVICYEFLWSHESEQGLEDGKKRRPSAIIVAAPTASGQTEVMVAPITHLTPSDPSVAIEIPPKVKAYLGLDAERSWVILAELNKFIWPGVDIRPVPGGRPDQYDYGRLPPLLFDKIRDGIIALDAARKKIIERTE